MLLFIKETKEKPNLIVFILKNPHIYDLDLSEIVIIFSGKDSQTFRKSKKGQYFGQTFDNILTKHVL